jgi:glycosyltransferase involved in cell wall biosynthesis
MTLDPIPKVSILMTVYNAGAHLEQTLESLSSQVFKSFEVIVLVHGCSDNSVDILKAWNDPRLVFEELTTNIGRTPALNYCLNRARGEYIAILDADDLAHPSRFAAQVTFLNANSDIGLVGTWSSLIDADGNVVGSSCPPSTHRKLLMQLAFRDPIVHSSIMFRRDIACNIGGYDNSYKYAQDFKMIIDFAKHTEIAVIEEFLCSWRSVTSSLTSIRSYQMVRAYDEYRIFRNVRTELKLNIRSKILNLKQIILTSIILRYRLTRSGEFRTIQSWRTNGGY